MSFCTQGLPEVAESTVSKSEGKPSPSREKVPEVRMRGEKEALQRYSLIISKTFSLSLNILIQITLLESHDH